MEKEMNDYFPIGGDVMKYLHEKYIEIRDANKIGEAIVELVISKIFNDGYFAGRAYQSKLDREAVWETYYSCNDPFESRSSVLAALVKAAKEE